MVRLEDRVFMDAQSAHDARSERLQDVLKKNPGKWMQLTGGIGIYVDMLTPPPVQLLSLIAAGVGFIGHSISTRRADELRRLTADGRARTWFSDLHGVFYRSDEAYLPESMHIDGKAYRYHENAFIERIDRSSLITRVHARIDDGKPIEMLHYRRKASLPHVWTRADLLTKDFERVIIRAYPVD